MYSLPAVAQEGARASGLTTLMPSTCKAESCLQLVVVWTSRLVLLPKCCTTSHQLSRGPIQQQVWQVDTARVCM